MREILVFFIFTLLLTSCNKENKKSDFIGNWSSISDENFDVDINIEFFKDSMVIDNSIMYGKYANKWKVVNNKIEQTLLRGNNSDLSYKNTNYYKFNLTKDTLFIKIEQDSILYLKFLKINNGFEYFKNKIGLDLELPTTNETLTSLENKDLFFNIYLGKQNDSIILKTDEYLQNFSKLEYQITSFYFSKNEQEKDNLKFTLFTDKSINNIDLDSIKNILKKSPIKKFFRIYNSEKYIKDNWKAEINWVGKHEN